MKQSGWMIINLIINYVFLHCMELWICFLKCFLCLLLLLNLFTWHSYLFIQFSLMIQEMIRFLKSLQIDVNIVPILNIFFNLMSPFTTLCIIHHLLIVTIIKQNPDLCFCLVLKVKPQFLYFIWWINHVTIQLFQWNFNLGWFCLVCLI